MAEIFYHTFDPVYDNHSRVLILGSFPSVKSREQGFYYGHPQNRFWKVFSAVFSSPVPQSIDEKKKLLLDNGVALWDVAQSCEINGSSDSSMKNVRPNDIYTLLYTNYYIYSFWFSKSTSLSSCSLKLLNTSSSTSPRRYSFAASFFISAIHARRAVT